MARINKEAALQGIMAPPAEFESGPLNKTKPQVKIQLPDLRFSYAILQ